MGFEDIPVRQAGRQKVEKMAKQKDSVRDLQKEIKDMGIIAIEGYNGIGSPESVFAALDAIREYDKQNLKKEKSEEKKLPTAER